MPRDIHLMGSSKTTLNEPPIGDEGGATTLKKSLFDKYSTFPPDSLNTEDTQQHTRVTEMKNLLVLLVAALASATGAEEVIYAQVGDTVALKPPQGINLQKYYLYWMFGKEDGLQLAWRNTLNGDWTTQEELWRNMSLRSDNSLVLKHIQREHFGTFFLKKKFSVGETSITSFKLLKLTVTVDPPSPLLPGDSLSLSCNAEPLQGHKSPEIHWLNPRGETKTGRVTLRATSQDNGRWTCVVTNDDKVNEAKVSVTVVDLSPAPLRPQYTSESLSLTVPCSLPAHISWGQIKAKDIKEIHWHFTPRAGSSPQRLFSLSLEDPLTWRADQPRGLRPVSDPKKGDLSLTRNRGREDDAGEYVCALEFKNGVTVHRTVHVKVLRVASSPGTHLISGQQLNLTCGLGHPLPSDLRLKWSPPEQSSLLLTPDRHAAHITVPEVGTGDGGKWRCELWQSDERLTSAEITLKIDPKLSVWMLVVICSITVIVILLLVLVFILCRRRKQKRRHLRRQLCQCKTPKPKGFYRT
ncbi:LOW QUALITY PROTEIN: T-cell surface glycoprotein CD4-like [Cottoperca gobio]|uniref:LOW QUALITY PROTEIN: T-cell surface glycoprotein CD4-like n=1 Tax=Cottoperca gobio TaxID=56716 RepID=A0A6J2R9H5_COTGO|nr:LOW QUALITY PROTEIN: T-cell surface glycoprotein CD4-like [Cottoperca gobio]